MSTAKTGEVCWVSLGGERGGEEVFNDEKLVGGVGGKG